MNSNVALHFQQQQKGIKICPELFSSKLWRLLPLPIVSYTWLDTLSLMSLGLLLSSLKLSDKSEIFIFLRDSLRNFVIPNLSKHHK